MNAAIYGPIIAVLVTALCSYLAASRRLSGKINTSSADLLWAESKAIREDYREQLSRANGHITELETRVEACEARCAALTDEKRELKNQISEHEELLERIRRQDIEIKRLMQLLEQQANATLEVLHNHDEETTPDA